MTTRAKSFLSRRGSIRGATTFATSTPATATSSAGTTAQRRRSSLFPALTPQRLPTNSAGTRPTTTRRQRPRRAAPPFLTSSTTTPPMLRSRSRTRFSASTAWRLTRRFSLTKSARPATRWITSTRSRTPPRAARRRSGISALGTQSPTPTRRCFQSWAGTRRVLTTSPRSRRKRP